MATFFNIHHYLLLNAALAFSYLSIRLLFSLSLFKESSSAVSRLHLARFGCVVIIFTFLFAPNIMTLFPYASHSNFQLGPLLHEATTAVLTKGSQVTQHLLPEKLSHSFLSIAGIFLYVVLCGMLFFLIKQLKNLFLLYQLNKTSHRFKCFKHIHLLVNHHISIPCCWTNFKNYFVILPAALIEKNQHLRIAIAHELQHIKQGDTWWLHFFALIKIGCFWNPFIYLWTHYCFELQEFACDEALIISKKVSADHYAECLVEVASASMNHLIPTGALGIHGFKTAILYRRVEMLFDYKKVKTKLISILCAYFLLSLSALSAAFALNTSGNQSPITLKQLAVIIAKAHLDDRFQLRATPELVNELNNIRGSRESRQFVRASLQRMQRYQGIINAEIKNANLPDDLRIIPLVESGYQPLPQSKNPAFAAGIWQIIPDTAKHLGLVINSERDDRMDTQLSTQAALHYLNMNYGQFQDWKLACIAYEIGEKTTDQLIRTVGSRDPWVLARSFQAPQDLKKFLPRFDAMLLIYHEPTLIS